MLIGCPLCNGVAAPGQCPVCGAPLEDLGMAEDYFGPYSPYEDGELIEYEHLKNHENPLTCIHLVHCPRCCYQAHWEVPM